MCRRRNQTYIASSISSAPVYTSNCRGRRQRYQHQQALVPVVAFPQQAAYEHLTPNPHSNSTALAAQEQFFLRPAACKRERRGRCCNHNHLATTYIPTTNTAQSGAALQSQSKPLDLTTLQTRRTRGPVSAMASLLIAGIAIGAHKISEKRKEKKAQKAQHGAVEIVERQEGDGPRKSEEARLERRSSSVYSDDEREREGVPMFAPPSYDDAVAGQGSVGAGRGGA